MDTLKELIDYCDETNPVGAILLTGEWGCGKTYFIEHVLKNSMSDSAVILRISMFGMDSTEALHREVREAWIKTNFKHRGLENLIAKINKAKLRISNLIGNIPKPIVELTKVEWQAFIDIKNTIDDKKVILVFDDLERSNIDLIDALGAINDYCENKLFHTIIIANEDVITNQFAESGYAADVCINGDADGNGRRKEYTGKISFHGTRCEIPYSNIKEKIIRRTIRFEPDYNAIVGAIIDDFKHQDVGYCDFIKRCKEDLTALFSFDYAHEDKNEDIEMKYESLLTGENAASKPRHKPQHNIRSLKCAINDFHRLYVELNNNNIDNLELWLYSYVSYVIAYRMGLGKSGRDGQLYADNEIYETFPMCRRQYLLDAEIKWITEGKWDDRRIQNEIKLVINRNKAMTPAEIVKSHHVAHIEDDVLSVGFPEVLEMAYDGDLSLDEYVQLISNCSFARVEMDGYPSEIDWNKVNTGIDARMNMILKSSDMKDKQLSLEIGPEQINLLNDNEKYTYERIIEFDERELLESRISKEDYIEELGEDPLNALSNISTQTFNIFDEDMAGATADAFCHCKNEQKETFIRSFSAIWHWQIISRKANQTNFINGLERLVGLLNEMLRDMRECGSKVAAWHTEAFIEKVSEVIGAIKTDNVIENGAFDVYSG